jgi:hypothetical protein
MNNDDVIECTYLNKESDNSASITINGTVVSNTIGENLAETLGEVYKNYLKK